MKRCVIAIALCIVVSGCDHVRRSTFAPVSEGLNRPTEFFVLSGRIGDSDGAAVAGASVLLTTDRSVQATTSGANGEYRFDNVRGHIGLLVSKEGFSDAAPFSYIDRDQTLNVQLLRLQGPLELVAGTPLRASVQSPPCDPIRWDSRALCERVFFTTPTSDPYEIVLIAGSGSALDMLIDNSLYYEGSRELHAPLPGGAAGQRWEIRIHAYYSPTPFTLMAIPQRPVP